MKYRIENSFLRVDIESLGGALSSIFDKENNDEILYQPEVDSWQGQDVAIFPFVARLKDKKYTYKGKTYSLRNHGLCRYYEFGVVEQKEDKLIMLFKSNKETLKEYPFLFHFYITYQLNDKSLSISYKVVNDNEETMPFGIGAHPAFKLNGEKENGVVNTSGNYLYFDKPSNLTRVCFDGKGEMVVSEEDYGFIEKIDIDKDLFVKYKTLCLKGDNLSDVYLLRKDQKKIKFHYDDINYFVLWSFPDTGSFAAIEPWISLPDYIDADSDIIKKKTLVHLDKKEQYIFHYSISLE